MTEKEKKEICNKCDISYACDYKSMPDCEDFKKKEIKSIEDCKWFGAKTPQKPCGQCGKNCQYNDNETQKDCQKEIEEMSKDITDVIYSENQKAFDADVNAEALCTATEYVGEKIADYLATKGYGKIETYKKCLSNAINHHLKETKKYEEEIERLKSIIATNKQCSKIDLAFEDEYGLDTKQEKQQAVDKEYALKITQDGCLSIFDIVREQAIKEFSEKLRDKLGYCDEDYDMHYSFYQSDLDEILKEYGVLDLKTNKE